MKTNVKSGIGVILTAMLLVSMLLMPAVSAKAETTWHSQMLESNGISTNDFDVKLTSYEKIGEEIHYTGDFKIDVEKMIDGKLKTLKSKGTISGIVNQDGTINVEYSGNNFNFVLNSMKIGDDQENVLYQFDQVLTVDGKTENSKDIIKVPKNQITLIDKEMQASLTEDQVSSFLKSKTKVDLPSTAPGGSLLIYNDVQYADLLVTGGIIIAILVFFSMGTTAGLGAIVLAVAVAVPEYYDVDTRDIYIDFFLTLYPLSTMHVEVDYFYY
ncbi:hypothetical protein [Methanococcoides burtonii]|uniref:Uncharacterized protein n=1 Tax=Methanococcoides burtonii (strain DSM 6242 / NBRC 107633 / OCM 468 / ACE-M) TaxID=259564 RepID=Q12V21_METBU|nr:hypothetical protein [Methanococcoides burtonii]ABE52705.1 Hypothetical protein Mbur_1819 [Methanococcoides burtonii DSM 6242]